MVKSHPFDIKQAKSFIFNQQFICRTHKYSGIDSTARVLCLVIKIEGFHTLTGDLLLFARLRTVCFHLGTNIHNYWKFGAFLPNLPGVFSHSLSLSLILRPSFDCESFDRIRFDERSLYLSLNLLSFKQFLLSTWDHKTLRTKCKLSPTVFLRGKLIDKKK